MARARRLGWSRSPPSFRAWNLSEPPERRHADDRDEPVITDRPAERVRASRAAAAGSIARRGFGSFRAIPSAGDGAATVA